MECHECRCFINPPCNACVDCRHWDIEPSECDNACDKCDVNHDVYVVRINMKRGIHESDGEPSTCVEPHGKHECGRTLFNGQHQYLPTEEHRCHCGFIWVVI